MIIDARRRPTPDPHLNASHVQCACCGHYTISAPAWSWSTGGEQCPVCGWATDFLQEHDWQLARGANRVSLTTALANYQAFGAVEWGLRGQIRRARPDELDSVERYRS